jgi:hypothetical protein
VDGGDLAIAAKALGSYAEHTRWNSRCHVTHDGVIDGSDIAQIARKFG